MEMDFATLANSSNKEKGIPVASVDVDSIYHKDEAEVSSSEPAESDPIQEQVTPVEPQPQQQPSLMGDVEIEDEVMPSISTLDIEDDSSHININIDSLDKEASAKEPEKQEVLMLFIDKVEGTPIDGAKLLPTLLTLGFKYGEMDLFHRHQDSSGKGEVLFSLANMFNPGTFDIDNMEQLSTRGLTIFMTLPNALEPLQTFNMMHNAAKKIADEFGATVLDDKRNPLDVAIVRSYVEKIRKFQC
jgi:cell division protein ZipA